MKFFPKDVINNISALVQIMAWRRPGDKPLSEPMLVIYWRIYSSLGLNELKHLYTFYQVWSMEAQQCIKVDDMGFMSWWIPCAMASVGDIYAWELILVGIAYLRVIMQKIGLSGKGFHEAMLISMVITQRFVLSIVFHWLRFSFCLGSIFWNDRITLIPP